MLRVARSNVVEGVLMAGLIWTDDRMCWKWVVHGCALSASVLIAWRAGFISAVERMRWMTAVCFGEGDVIAWGVTRKKRKESVYS